jgi:hypothetical protein
VEGDEERWESGGRAWEAHRDGLGASKKRLERPSSWTERV